jgi:hypothetical protein
MGNLSEASKESLHSSWIRISILIWKKFFFALVPVRKHRLCVKTKPYVLPKATSAPNCPYFAAFSRFSMYAAGLEPS